MAEIYGYFNGIEYDSEFPRLRSKALVPNGVYDGDLHVYAGSGMQVSIREGRAWIDGGFYYSDGIKTFSVPTAHATLSRIDTIVLRQTLSIGEIKTYYVQGTPDSSPVAPNITRNNDIYELKLAELKLPAGASSITNAMITDTRYDKSVCGITSGFEGLDVEALTEQAQEQFDQWFEQIKGQLSEDAAGNLQNQINSIESSKGAANGIATLDASGKVVQNPASTGVANGIATLDADGRLTVAQTAITTGSNANGTWIRFPDGTQICTKIITISMKIETADGSMYYGTRTSLGDFAMPFTEAPAESLLLTTGPSAFLDVARDITATSAGSVNLYKSLKMPTVGDYPIHVIAIGKWK